MQVDESPRYASVGRWQHAASFSTWTSGTTRAFWQGVQGTWASDFAREGTSTSRGQVDRKSDLPLFKRADEIEAGKSGGDAPTIRAALDSMREPVTR